MRVWHGIFFRRADCALQKCSSMEEEKDSAVYTVLSDGLFIRAISLLIDSRQLMAESCVLFRTVSCLSC